MSESAAADADDAHGLGGTVEVGILSALQQHQDALHLHGAWPGAAPMEQHLHAADGRHRVWAGSSLSELLPPSANHGMVSLRDQLALSGGKVREEQHCCSALTTSGRRAGR